MASLLENGVVYAIRHESVGIVLRDRNGEEIAVIKAPGVFASSKYYVYDSKEAQIGSILFAHKTDRRYPSDLCQGTKDVAIAKMMYDYYGGVEGISDVQGKAIARINSIKLSGLIISDPKGSKIAELSPVSTSIAQKALQILGGNRDYTSNVVNADKITPLILIEAIAAMMLYNVDPGTGLGSQMSR